MSDLLEDMYPQAVEAGIPATEFWSMTFEEIMIQVQANHSRKESDLRERAYFDYTQQRLAIFGFNDPKKFPAFEDAYPFMKQIEDAIQKGKSEEQQFQEEMQRQQEIMIANAEAIKATRERNKK